MGDKNKQFLYPDDDTPPKTAAPITNRADDTDTSVPSIAEQEAQKQEFNQRTLAGATSIGAAPSGSFGHPIVWMQELQNDLKHGSGITSVGRVLQHVLPQNGAYGGKSEAAADFAAGPFLGPPKAIEGVLTTGHGIGTGNKKETIQGVNKTFQGVGQTVAPIAGVTNPAFIPAMVGAGITSKVAQKGAEYLGADADTQELAGNVASIALPAAMKAAPKIAKAIVKNPGTAAKAIVIPSAIGSVGAIALHNPLAAIPSAIGEAAYLPKAIKTTTGLIKTASPVISATGGGIGAAGEALSPGTVGDIYGGAVKQGPGQIPANLNYSIPVLNKIPMSVPASVAGQGLLKSQDEKKEFLYPEEE